MTRYLLPPLAMVAVLLAGMAAPLAQSAGDPPVVQIQPGVVDWQLDPAPRGGDDCVGGEIIGNASFSHFFRLTVGANIGGQSWTAPCTGQIDLITIRVYAHTDGTASPVATGELRIYEDEGGAGTLLHTKDYAINAPAQGTHVEQAFSLAPDGVVVEAGSMYTFALVQTDGQLQVLALNDNAYDGGSLVFATTGDPDDLEPYFGAGGEPFDMTFTVTFGAPVVSIEPGSAGQVRLGAAFPNPAAGRVVIPLELQVTEQVEIALYDVLGRRVAEIAAGMFEAGAHEVSSHVGSLAPGMYVYRASVGGEILSGRLVVVR